MDAQLEYVLRSIEEHQAGDGIAGALAVYLNHDGDRTRGDAIRMLAYAHEDTEGHDLVRPLVDTLAAMLAATFGTFRFFDERDELAVEHVVPAATLATLERLAVDAAARVAALRAACEA